MEVMVGHADASRAKLGYALSMLAIHGGAGNFGLANTSEERIAQCKEVLRDTLQVGKAKLAAGASCVEIVEACVLVMEDSPLFNAGRGSVFTHEGRHELEACIMSGREQRAGAVTAVSRIKNPVRAARAVLEVSDHVLLSAAGAELFAQEQGLALVDPSYFATDERRQQLEQALGSERSVLDHEGSKSEDKFGTVGAVALDQHGDLAAATSTGGMTNKRFGRIGDTPIIGAGTFADSRVAVSCTGHGEYFMRYTVASEVAARVRLANQPLQVAALAVIEELGRLGGSGGLIAIDHKGAITLPMNTTGMYRGWLDEAGGVHVAALADGA